MSTRVIGAFESTYLPRHDIDVVETTGHAARWPADLRLLEAAGVRRLRYPIRWHRVEQERGVYDWRATDRVLGHLHDRGMAPIADLVHHTSYPRWLVHGFADPRFGPAYLRYCEAFARRYPWMPGYTLFNEPFSTLFLGGHEGVWPPYWRGMRSMVELLANVLPALAEASRMYADLLPGAEHLYVDSCERHTAGPGGEEYAAMANDRRFFVLDALLGRDLDPARPFVAKVLEAGGEDLLALPPGRIDVLGLDYYAHSQWHFTALRGEFPTPRPARLSDLILEYARRYGLPCMLSETNLRGLPSDRATWLKYTLEQYELAQQAGADLRGYCWFPFVDSCDWDTLLFHHRGSIDPVGVYWLDEDLRRRPSCMSASYALAARGVPAAELPAYRLSPEVADHLAGYRQQMAHWDWKAPPIDTAPTDLTTPNSPGKDGLKMTELVVLSHLRWDWVWQRPQHLISRLARDHDRTWFVEEPQPCAVPEPRLRVEPAGPVTRVWMDVPGVPTDTLGGEGHLYFDAPEAADLPARLLDLLGRHPGGDRTVWLYSPSALDVARALNPAVLVYDVMDDLASFAAAPPELALRQRQALKAADVVFAGGRSLHRMALAARPDAHLFPSGVEAEHYAAARAVPRRHERPVAGYVGVLDERLDFDLVAGLAEALPDWDIQMVGPLAKITAERLPVAPNLIYTGPQTYERLPEVMAGFDVALMPFALNEATRSISPTKTLEYLAAGLPVVSTRVPDVIAEFGGVVDLREDAQGFAEGCRHVLGHGLGERDRQVRPLLAWHSWDGIVERMTTLLRAAQHSGIEAGEETA